MIKFVHTADLHLGLQFNKVSFDKDKAYNRRSELWSTFQRIVDYSVKICADFLFISGDLFEADYFTLGDIKRVRDILETANDVNVLISAGNHDLLNVKSLYKRIEWSDNVTIFNTIGLEYKDFPHLNTRVYGYSWDKPELNENDLFKENLDLDKNINNILIIHGDIGKESKYLPMEIDQLKKLNMDYIALGHIHKPNIYNSNIAYCGCPEPLNFGETGPRGIIKGIINDGKTEIEFMPFSKRTFYEITIELNENMGHLDIVNEIKEVNIGNPSMDFYRIKLKGYIQRDIDINNFKTDLDDVFYHLELIDETTPDYDLDELEDSNRENIIGLYIKNMKEKNLDDDTIRDALYLGLDALMKVR